MNTTDAKQEARKPRFDGTINLGHLLTAGTMLIGGMVVWTQSQIMQAKQDLRITYVEQTTASNTEALKKLSDGYQQLVMSQERVTITLELLTKGQKKL